MPRTVKTDTVVAYVLEAVYRLTGTLPNEMTPETFRSTPGTVFMEGAQQIAEDDGLWEPFPDYLGHVMSSTARRHLSECGVTAFNKDDLRTALRGAVVECTQ